jgi:hypothetical protein
MPVLTHAPPSCLRLQMDEAAVGIPPGMPIYDVQTDFPHHFQPRSKLGDMVARVAKASPEMLNLLRVPAYPLPYPGARSILRWETTMVKPPHLKTLSACAFLAWLDLMATSFIFKALCWLALQESGRGRHGLHAASCLGSVQMLCM